MTVFCVCRWVCSLWWLVGTTVQAKDATSASKKNYSSSVDANYHLSINVMNSCPHTAMETKCYCVTTELSIKIDCHTYYANL